MSIRKSLHESIRKALSLTEDTQYNLSDEDFNMVKTAIDNYIAKYPYHFKDRAFEIYVDYQDELDDSTIKEIFESERPFDAFYDIIGDWDWWESADPEYDEIFKQLELDEDFKEENRDNIMEYLRDYISYTIPYDHFDKTVGFDVFLNDSEGANYEYGEPALKYADEDNEESQVEDVNTTIALLLQTQGHSKEEFISYINEKKEGNKFFDSLISEIEDTTYNTGNQFVFLCQASITEMAKAIQEQGTITIPSDCMCGLFNGGNGSGSDLEVKLEKSVTGSVVDMNKSPLNRVGTFEVYYKDGYSYSVDDTYGLVYSAWNTNVKFEEKVEQNA